ncbi:hypothetical protein C8Q72DRAFT_830573 [Fomitopsis betulina]|nr:hypothetical protein C8Q72DRAFT_830573 [Fomitopsis betulina]
MPITVELIVVDLKEGVGKDDATFKKLREGAAKGGLKRQSFGLSIEHPNKLYWIGVFENGLEPKDFKWPEEEYGNFTEQLKAISTSDFTRRIATCRDFPNKVVEAPVTETAIATLKAGADIQKLKESQEEVGAKLSSAPGVHASAYGIVKEAGSQDVLLLFVGWDSVEAHNAVRAEHQNDPLVALLRAAVEKMELVHVAFTNEA